MPKLEDIDGVGPKTVELLESKNILTVNQLAIMDPEQLSVILGISVAKAKKMIKSAKDLTKDSIKIVPALDEYQLREERTQWISTGSEELDRILGGRGVPTDAITAFFGEIATGKSQLCKQLVVNMKKQHGRASAWIETEPRTLQIERIKEMAEAQGVDFDLRKDLFVVPARFIETPTHMFQAYEIIEDKIKEGMDIGLLVIDSFNAKFRSTYSGRETLGPRSQEQARHMGYLQILASKYNIAIVLTLQVMGIPDSGQQLGAIKKYGIRKPPVVSDVAKHSINYLIGLDQVSSSDKTWSAVIADGPVPRDSCLFMITEYGIEDVKKRKGVR